MPLSTGLRLAIAILSALVLASALATVGASFMLAPRPPWALLGFELLTIAAGLFGLAAASGRFSDGPGLALACVAGTVFAASVFGYLGATGQIGEWKLRPWLIGRSGAAFVLGLLAAWVVLRRTTGALRVALRGTVYIGAALGFFGLFAMFDGELRPASGGMQFVAHAAFSAITIVSLAGCLFLAVVTLVSRPGPDDPIPKWMSLLGQLALPVLAGLLVLTTSGHTTTTLSGAAEIIRISLFALLALVLTGSLCAGIHILVQAFASCALPEPSALTPTRGATSS